MEKSVDNAIIKSVKDNSWRDLREKSHFYFTMYDSIP